MKNTETEQEAESCRKDSDQGKKIERTELNLQAILEIARAVQHIRTLEELSGTTFNGKWGKISGRSAAAMLQKLCCDPRRIIALMLFAADNPDWAWVNFWFVFCPGMSVRQMAKLRKINFSTVKYHLERIELPMDAYDMIPENY